MKDRALVAVVVVTLGSVLSVCQGAAKVQHRDNTWVLENERLEVEVHAPSGRISVRDKNAAYTWRQPTARAAAATDRFRNVERLPGPQHGISFETNVTTRGSRTLRLNVKMTVPEVNADVIFEVDATARHVPIDSFVCFDPLVLDAPKACLALSAHGDGLLIDATDMSWRGRRYSFYGGPRLDMPWIGLTDMSKGYICLMETADDGAIVLRDVLAGGRKTLAPQVRWRDSKGAFRYPRKWRYRFCATGGYVALAKSYREYAGSQGLLKTLRQKRKENPNVEKLMGAPDIWGADGIAFCREAKAAGMDRALVNGRFSPDVIRHMNELGYLTGEYDNYVDISERKARQLGKAPMAEYALRLKNAKHRPNWRNLQGKIVSQTWCSKLAVDGAKILMPRVLKQYPFNARFLDCTTAGYLLECWDEKHPLTRGDDREWKTRLLEYVSSLGLVTGGERGIYWGVPGLHYLEGMMGYGFYTWPAGHLTFREGKDKIGDRYLKYGIGHYHRVPLWELVFHDCIVTTWYWGDSSHFLHHLAPEISDKKDAFNVLYGTIPLLWASGTGCGMDFHRRKDRFLQTYRNTCKLHEQVGYEEMLTHEFVTPDRAVHRTRFSDGAEVVVNFGKKPYATQLAGRSYVLPQNGFAVKGPRIEQSLALVGGRAVTSIRTPDYLFTDAGGVQITARRISNERLRIYVGAGETASLLRPRELVPKWNTAGARLFLLDAKGQRTAGIELRRRDNGLQLGPFAKGTAIEALCGSEAAVPDLRFDPARLAVSPDHPKQGQQIELSATVRNDGGAAGEVEVAFYADACEPSRKVASRTVSLAPDATQTSRVRVDTSRLDGPRRILAVIDPEDKVKELCALNNRTSRAIEVAPDLARWPHRRELLVDAGGIAREDEPVVVALDLPGADPASVRVVERDRAGALKAPVPAQFDPAQAGRGELCFVLTGQTPAHATRRFAILWADAPLPGKPSRFFSPSESLWDPLSTTIKAKTYQLAFDHGVITQLAARHDGVAGDSFIRKLILSSKETGWSHEPGTVERFQVLHAGPVRTIVVVRKALKAGVVYEKTYTFYPRRFDVTVSVNKPAGGLYSRARYLQVGQYVDDKGFRATVDGKGNAESVAGKNRNPKWYAVYAGDWAHSCVALSQFSGITYWDNAGAWGEIGLSTSATRGVRMSYVIHPGAKDASFARADYARLRSPVSVTAGRAAK